MSKLMVIDDEPSICWALSQLGASMGHEVVTASSAEKALEQRDQTAPDVIVLDVRLPGMDGLTAIDHLRSRFGPVPMIVVTAYGDLETAVEAVHRGAFDYLIKPFDLDHVQRALERALTVHSQVTAELGSEQVHGMLGTSPALQEVFKRIALAAHSDACVLISGESGTGKELAARAVHRYSPRGAAPFVAVNVASLSVGLAESELFGHLSGAFTGADHARVGLLAQAHGGTLFLDEVADIPLPIQVKLLRVLDHGEVTPVGSNEPVKTDFRVVSATHRDLLQRVATGQFRHDLFFRLCAFRIDIPPLRERVEDIAELARHFVTTGGRKPTAAIADQTYAELRRRPWYGNVRELRNAVEHATILARGGVMMPEHLPSSAPEFAPAGDEQADPITARIAELIADWAARRLEDEQPPENLYEELLALIEPPLLRAVLQKHHGQYAGAARTLGLHRTTLKKKVDDYGEIKVASAESK